jgi:hypothetical protein
MGDDLPTQLTKDGIIGGCVGVVISQRQINKSAVGKLNLSDVQTQALQRSMDIKNA